MDPRPSTDALERRMAAVRSGLAADVEDVVDGAREVFDWKTQLRRHPVPVAAAAAVAGYMLVPSRPIVVRPDSKQMAELAKNQQVVVTDKQLRKSSAGLGATLMTLLGGFVARTATAYVSQQAGAVFGRTAAESSEVGR